MDRGLRRCTGFTILRCLGCHFAAVAADKTVVCNQYGHAARRCHQRCLLNLFSRRISIDGVIPAAFARVRKNRTRVIRLGPAGVRVTTALRCVVTRTLRFDPSPPPGECLAYGSARTVSTAFQHGLS